MKLTVEDLLRHVRNFEAEANSLNNDIGDFGRRADMVFAGRIFKRHKGLERKIISAYFSNGTLYFVLEGSMKAAPARDGRVI